MTVGSLADEWPGLQPRRDDYRCWANLNIPTQLKLLPNIYVDHQRGRSIVGMR
jgi:hypothetical protein